MTRQMKKIIMLLGCLCLLPFAACAASKPEARFEAFRAALADAAVSVTAEVTARDGQFVTDFTLRCTETDGGYTVEVLAPETLSGVTAHIAQGETQLQFDDLILPMPQAEDTLSPLMALPKVLEAARDGHLDLVWEEDGLVAQLIPDDTLAVRLCLNEENTPVSAEVDADGRTCVFCAITAWSTETRETNEPNDTNLGGDQPGRD